MSAYAAMPVHGGGPQSRGGALMRQSTPPYAAGPHAPPQSGGGHAHPYFGGAGNNVGQCQHQPSPPSSSSSSSQPLPNQQNQFQGEVGNAARAASYQHSAIAIGNPTPPLTPATGVPPYAVCSSQAIAAAAAADVKPTIIIGGGGGGDLLKANVTGAHASASCQQPQPQAQPLDSKCAIGDTKPAITNANASEWA